MLVYFRRFGRILRQMKTLFLLFGMLTAFTGFSQTTEFLGYCQHAYEEFPLLPRGILEASAFTQTRFDHLSGNQQESCSGLPQSFGYFGMVADGKGYFKENLSLVAGVSKFSENEIRNNPQTEVLAYAKTLNHFYSKVKSLKLELSLVAVLSEISYLSDSGKVNLYARDAEAYELFRFLNDNVNAAKFHFPAYHLDLNVAFGQNAALLGATKVIFGTTGIETESGLKYKPSVSSAKSTEYTPAIWNPAPTCNYSSRNGTAISAITIHTIQGSYAGAISWAQNCNSSVSYHYVVRSSDGQVTQMVAEANKAWHVGSENPYTIGYEHEGYVDNASWYTTAMYNASAGITRDICQSGYGISPLRTFSGAATSGTNVLGGCTKIKGHQHFPNQSHTDPGINWNWALYYTLVNNNPAQTVVSTATGTFTDSGGAAANYSDDERTFTLIQPAGASSITLTFSAFNTEVNWDYMYIYDGATNTSPLIGTYTGTNSPGTVTSSGGSLLVEFRSDCSTVAAGWSATWTSVIPTTTPPDAMAPTTAINSIGQWITDDFSASFIDQDNAGGSGLEKAYYQVIDYDGTDWRANAGKGFFSDNFDQAAIHTDWTSETGTWALSNGALTQTDEANANTNIHTDLTQDLSNRYLYHWAGSISGAGTNRRAGFHYFCSDATLPNRGNSYFVFFRLDNAKVQLYKVTNDTYALVDEVSFTFTAGSWYDFKVIYDRISGKHQVYIDNALVQTYVDAAPYTTGNAISFRSANATYAVNNLKVYRSRYPTVNIGIDAGQELRYQSPGPSEAAGRIKSIVQDSAGNLSAIQSLDVLVDWTPPLDVSLVNDGVGADIATSNNTSTIEANWSTTTDPNSDINSYWYAVGTTAGGTDIVPWTDNYWNTNVSIGGLSLQIGTIYYVSVKTKNGAGLFSGVTSSNGQLIVAPTDSPVANFFSQNTIVCNTENVFYENTSSNSTSYEWTFEGGFPATSSDVEPGVQYSASGTFDVTLVAIGPAGSDTIVQTVNVEVSSPVSASFSTNAAIVYLPNAMVTCTNSSQNANGYIWDFGDGATSTDVNPWNQYSVAGEYDVQLIAANDACPNDTALIHVSVIDNVGLSESELDNLSVFPNPSSDIVTVISTAENLNVKLYDVSGRLILERKMSGKQIELNVSGLSNGMYRLVLVDKTDLILSENILVVE